MGLGLGGVMHQLRELLTEDRGVKHAKVRIGVGSTAARAAACVLGLGLGLGLG